MKFGPVQASDASGCILAHSMDVSGVRWRKGRRLTQADIDTLYNAGVVQVVVARLDSDDVGEDEAAAQIAASLVPDAAKAHLRLTAATTGRVNFYATGPGVLILNEKALNAANRIDPMVTIATVPAYAKTRSRGMVATVKIIPYAIERSVVSQVAAKVQDAIKVRPVVSKTATLLITDIGGGPGKGEDATRDRLASLGMELSDIQILPHRVTPLAEAISNAGTDLVLILTGSATSDIDDVAPTALRQAGGQVSRFGMPVDPGNLLFLGKIGERPVIGLPGCARSPALNGADWVLERIVCGVEISDDDIAGMGVGGLLKESPARPHPREKS